MWRIHVVNGPNLNLLGEREPGVYGSQSIRDLFRRLRAKAASLNCSLSFFQSNHEGEIIDYLHDHRVEMDGLIINPGGLTHTSVALRDALAAVARPAVEVHISDISKRETFRRHSYIRDVCIDQLTGLGIDGYELALEKLVRYLKQQNS